MNIQLIHNRVPSSDGVHKLYGTVYLPEGEIRGIFHVVHGMQEYIGRYDAFMRNVAEQGYLCCGFDNLGHGNTAKDAAELGYIAHKDGWKYLVEDVQRYAQFIRSQYDAPSYTLMGHSMGSFIVRLAVTSYPKLCDKLIIMGTGGSTPAAKAGKVILRSAKTVKGEHSISPAIEKMIFGNYNKRFSGNTPVEWLTKDRHIIEKYLADPFCNFHFSLSAMQDLVKLNLECNRKQWFNDVPRYLPILLVSGADDPVGDYGRGVKKVYDRLKANGAQVSLKLYVDCRHEILNDTCQKKVCRDIISFIE